MIRCAQPLIGSSVRRCKEDEALVNAMLTQRHKKGWILDTRHPNIVKNAQSRGKYSIEKIFNYQNELISLKVVDANRNNIMHFGNVFIDI